MGTLLVALNQRPINVTKAIALKAREFWSREDSLEQHVKPKGRRWTPPLAKVLDEWNWIRITKGHPFAIVP